MPGSPEPVSAPLHHGLIGDGRTFALVASDGEIAWHCWPTSDAPSVFAAPPCGPPGGRYRIAPCDDATTTALCALHEPNVLVTTFTAAAATAELEHFMPRTGPQRLIRRLTCTRGAMSFRLDCEPRFNRGQDRHSTAISPDGATFRSPTLTLTLRTRVPLRSNGHGVTAEFALHAGESVIFELRDSENSGIRLTEAGARALLQAAYTSTIPCAEPDNLPMLTAATDPPRQRAESAGRTLPG